MGEFMDLSDDLSVVSIDGIEDDRNSDHGGENEDSLRERVLEYLNSIPSSCDNDEQYQEPELDCWKSWCEKTDYDVEIKFNAAQDTLLHTVSQEVPILLQKIKSSMHLPGSATPNAAS